jgi:hypothetical protein
MRPTKNTTSGGETMDDRGPTDRRSGGVTRRKVVRTGALLGASALAAPWIMRSRAKAQTADLAAYQSANIDWRQAEGEALSKYKKFGRV